MLPEPGTTAQAVLPDPATIKPLVVPTTILDSLDPRGMQSPVVGSGWTEITGSSSYMTFDSTGMRLERNASGVAMLGIYRAVPWFPITITTKTSWSLIGNYNYGPGIIVGGDVNTGAFAFGGVKHDSYLAYSRFSSRTAWASYYLESSGSGVSTYVDRNAGYQQVYLADSTTAEFRYSDNGFSFAKVWGGTLTDTVTHYGLGGYPADATVGWWGEFEWVHIA